LKLLLVAIAAVCLVAGKAFANAAPFGVVYMMTGGSQTLSLPASPRVNEVYYRVPWAWVEPKKGQFDWSLITNIENQLPAGVTLQVVIDTGASGSPTNINVCSRWKGDPNPGCTAWMQSYSGVNVYSSTGPHGSSGGYDTCTPLRAPDPGSVNYQTAFAGLVTAINRQFNGDNKIALISLSPFSDSGGHIGLYVSDTCGGPGMDQTEYYNSAWNSVSGSGGNETTWANYLKSAFDTLWNDEVSTGTNINWALWSSAGTIPNVTSTNGGTDIAIRNMLFDDAVRNKPTGGGHYVLANESLQQAPGWYSAIKHWDGTPWSGNSNCSGSAADPHADVLGAQMVSTYAGNCAALKDAVENWGVPGGLNFVQIYGSDFTGTGNCGTEIGQIETDEGW
jgi:hypothetical protein